MKILNFNDFYSDERISIFYFIVEELTSEGKKKLTVNKLVIKKTLKFDPTKCNVFFLSLYLFIFP